MLTSEAISLREKRKHSSCHILNRSGDQPAISIHVLQDERPVAKNSRTLGRFEFGQHPANSVRVLLLFRQNHLGAAKKCKGSS